TGASDIAYGVSADASGVYVVGQTGGSLPGQTNSGNGGFDAFVRKYDADGTELWTGQFGPTSGFGPAAAYGVGADASGVYVVGYILTSNSDDAFVRKYSADGPTLLWSDQFGSSVTSDDYAYAVSVDASGVYVAGSVAGDGFVRKYGPNGPLMWSKTLDYGSDH